MLKNPIVLEENSYYYEVLYGALLHDIGKFFWRADKTQPSRYSHLSKDDTGLSGAHAKWSAEFFQTYLKGKIFEDVHNEIIEALILFHHRPESKKITINTISQDNLRKLIQIIQIADHASSGERIKREGEEEYGDTRIEVLHSIFSNISLEKSFSGESYYSLFPLTSGEHAREALFPKKSRDKAYGKYASDTQPLYRHLYSEFTKELELIIKNLKRITFSTLFNLFYKYTINIPSATFVDIPDISLFDHLKTTVSIAACLFLDLMAESNNSLEKLSEDKILDHKKNRYLFLEGNISGIQNFIYSISSKGAAKGLKGRSFFIQYLGELISKYILDTLKLPISCEIYCDGGNFYSIIPVCYEEELTRLTRNIKINLYNVFRGDLFIDFKWIHFNRYNLSIEPEEGASFSSLWTEINSLTGKEKFQRFNDILRQSEGYQRIFSPQGVGGKESDVCSICKQEKYIKAEEEKCPLCKSFEQLTRDIVNIKYILLTKLKQSSLTYDYEIKDINDFSEIFQYKVDFIEKDKDLENIIRTIRDKNLEKIDIFLINHTDLGKISSMIKNFDYDNLKLNFGFNFISDVIPFENGFIKDFDNIAEDNKTLGDNKIGFLRMDLDNLGRIFSEGLNPSSLSRLSSLSLRLKLFFKFWINEICKGNIRIDDLADLNYINSISEIHSGNEDLFETFLERIKNNVYLVYASGDDLFLIGHWNDVILLSFFIREIFSNYVMKNPNLTISAGIIINHSKFPLYQGAALAGIAEERAKLNEGKNSVVVLGENYYWEEFKELNLMKEKLYDYYKFHELKKSFFHKLLQFNKDYKEVYRFALNALKTTDKALVQNKNKFNLYYNVENNPEKTAHEAAYYSKWYWRFEYFIKRTIQRNTHLKAQLEGLEKNIIKNKKIKDLYLPVRWAELLSKQKSSS